MRCESLLHLALQLVPSLALGSYIPPADKDCRAFPGTGSWPSAQKWNKLNGTLDGQLIKPVAPGGVCHEGQPNFNKEKCPAVQKEWKMYDWQSDDPVSVMWDNLANWTCLPYPKMPCSTDGYPSFVINATTVDHVKAGINFARENNVRLVVKSSGHDFLGRSNAPGSLSIWMHHMNNITYHAGQYKLAGSNTVIDGDAVSCGGGTDMYDLYKATDKHGTTVVGGMAKSVSAGGYVTGGGHSQLSPDYGLAADNVLEIEVVTPDGKVLVVNEDQHSDLFWALRGGGGSTFGVITSFTMKAHPTPRVQQTAFVAATSPESPLADDFVAFLLSQVPSLMDAGLRGYAFLAVNKTSPIPIPGVPDKPMTGLLGSFTLLDQGPEAVNAIWDKLNSTIQERFNGTGTVFAMPVQSYGTWLEYYDINFDNNTAGSSTLMVSRLLGEEALAGDPGALMNAVKSATAPNGIIDFYLLGGKGVQEAKPRGGSNSVNPGWRKAFVHTLTYQGPLPFNKTSEREVKDTLNSAFEPFRELTPGLGAYLNEAAGFEKDPALTFWGHNYDRLLQIKRAVDPHDVFWCSPCVGNDRWREREDGQLCKVGAGRLDVDIDVSL